MVTPNQHKIYEFIQKYIDFHGYSPSLQEVAIGIGISPRSVSLISRGIHSLVEAGLLAFHKKGYRNIKVVSPVNLSLPFLGRIAAGSPIEAISDQQTLDMSFLIQQNHFILEVKGDSMIEEGIFDGDKVICKQQSLANDGDIIVALIDNNEATLKRIYFKPENKITLMPANAKLKPQIYDAERVQIQGLFIGLLRLPSSDC